MPKNNDIQKVLLIGSGPIVIGQAAEFDYSGTQACQALKEDGKEVILVNSNPATIMTDNAMADKIYIEPLTCLLYTSDAADDSLRVDLGGRRIIKKKNFFKQKTAYEISACLVGSEMCIRDRVNNDDT